MGPPLGSRGKTPKACREELPSLLNRSGSSDAGEPHLLQGLAPKSDFLRHWVVDSGSCAQMIKLW